MRQYHFDLIDTDRVSDPSGALLADDDQARQVAENLAREVRGTCPELIGQGYSIRVRSSNGDEVLRAPVDQPSDGADGT